MAPSLAGLEKTTMVVGVCHIEIIIHGSSSLKDKRRVLKSLLAQIKNRFNVSAAEVGASTLWQRGEIAIAAVGDDVKHINSVLDKVVNFAYETALGEIVDHSIEIISLKAGERQWPTPGQREDEF